MEAAHIPEDEVWNRLQSTCAIKLFVYHVENQCYKKCPQEDSRKYYISFCFIKIFV